MVVSAGKVSSVLTVGGSAENGGRLVFGLGGDLSFVNS